MRSVAHDHQPPFYCIHCEPKCETTMTEGGMGVHCREIHGVVHPQYWRDYLASEDWEHRKTKLQRIEEEMIAKFTRTIDSMIGADDFLTDFRPAADGPWIL